GDGPLGHTLQVVREVISEGLAAGGERVAVGVVGFGRENPVIGVVREARRRDAGNARILRLAVADRIEAISHAAGLRVRVGGDVFVGQAVNVVVIPSHDPGIGLRSQLFGHALPVAYRAIERVSVAGRCVTQRGYSVLGVVCERGLQTVWIRHGRQIAGRVVAVRGRVLAHQTIIHYGRQSIQAVVSIAHPNAVRIRRFD